MKSSSLVFFLVIPLLPVTSQATEELYCSGSGPACVLACITSAEQTRNIDLYSSLLADDYRYVLGNGEMAGWGRNEEIMAFTSSINDSARTWSADFAEGWSVSPGDSTDAWVLSNVNVLITITPKDTSKPAQKLQKTGMNYYVRAVAEPQPHFVIYRVYEPENAVSIIGEE